MNGCGVMTTSMISVVAAVVSPPLLIPPYSAIEPGGCAAAPHLPPLTHVLYNLFKVWQILLE